MLQLRVSPIPALLLLLPLLLCLVQSALSQQSSNTSHQHERNLLVETHTDYHYDHLEQEQDQEYGRDHEADHSRKGGFIDNMASSAYRLAPLQLGVEVLGLRLTPDLPEETVEQLRREVSRQRVVVVRDQTHLTPAAHLAVAGWFGKEKLKKHTLVF